MAGCAYLKVLTLIIPHVDTVFVEARLARQLPSIHLNRTELK